MMIGILPSFSALAIHNHKSGVVSGGDRKFSSGRGFAPANPNDGFNSVVSDFIFPIL